VTPVACPGCGVAFDNDAPRLCESCEVAVETAAEHAPECECAACLVWVSARETCAALGLTLADVQSELVM
jgi:hypothetical protein